MIRLGANTGWFRVAILVVYVAFVNFLCGYIAIEFQYPSLWNVTADFSEYAFPFSFSWALAHWPSMLIFGIPLLTLAATGSQNLKKFRIFCIAVFLLTLIELDAKIPFLLFPKVDSVSALFFSYVVAPPNKTDSPKSVYALQLLFGLAAATLIYSAFSSWQHRTPSIKTATLANGQFVLESIEVSSDYKREMIFRIELAKIIPDDRVCNLGKQVSENLFRDYPYDDKYLKRVHIRFETHEIAVLELPNKPIPGKREIYCYRTSPLPT